MLEVYVKESEQYNEQTNEFITIKPQILKLEHSLVSISKWESKWHKSFLSSNDKTPEEIYDYIRCMTVNQVSPFVYDALTSKDYELIKAYIDDPMTATTVKDVPGARRNNEAITSELIYYWMVALQIPFECEKWHINRLLTLIKVCNVKNQPSKNMPRMDILNQNRLLNEARRSKYHTKG